MISNETQSRLKVAVAFSVIYFIWGSTYISIRFAIESIPPYLMAGIRFTIAGLLLLLWQILAEPVRPGIVELRKSAVVGLLLIVGGNGTLVWSEQYLPSGLAALVLAIIPIWMVLLEWIFVTRKKPANMTLIGIFLGLTGVALLSGVDRSVLLKSSVENRSVFFYAGILMLAGFFWASGSLFSRTIRTRSSLLYLVSIQMLAGGIMLLVLSLIRGECQSFSLDNLSARSVLSVLYLIVFGSILTYSAYNWLLRRSAPAKVGTYAFFNPLVAVFLGWLLGGEPVTWRMMIGAATILTAVVLVNRSGFFRKKASRKE